MVCPAVADVFSGVFDKISEKKTTYNMQPAVTSDDEDP